jgi:hypothetical protein
MVAEQVHGDALGGWWWPSKCYRRCPGRHLQQLVEHDPIGNPATVTAQRVAPDVVANHFATKTRSRPLHFA